MRAAATALRGLGFAAALAAAGPAAAFDLNSFRARYKLPPLSISSALSGAAYAHAHDLARRGRLDHKGFRQRLGAISGTAAENVAYGCDDAACAFRMWAKSRGHRRNMLMKGISHYGLASATGANGRKYWVLELGN